MESMLRCPRCFQWNPLERDLIVPTEFDAMSKPCKRCGLPYRLASGWQPCNPMTPEQLRLLRELED